MANAYKYIEVVGTSTNTIEEAIKTALDSVSMNNKISWFEVIATRGRLVEDGTPEYQVTVKCGVLAA
jgi:dodecin